MACSNPRPAATEMHMRSSRSGRSFVTRSRRVLILRRSQRVGTRPPMIGRTKRAAMPTLTLDDTADEGHHPDAEAEHDEAHLDGDELLGAH